MSEADGIAWLRLKETAALLGVSLNTLRRWSDAGKIISYRSPGGHRRFKRSDVEDLLAGQATPGTVPSMVASSVTGKLTSSDAAALRSALGIIARVSTEGLGVSSCLVALVNGATLTAVAEHTQVATPRLVVLGDSIPLEEAPLAARVARDARRVVIPDLAATTALSDREAALYRACGDRALLCQPIYIGRQVVGVLELAESRLPRSFTGPNIAFAEFMARQAAAILQRHADGASEAKVFAAGVAAPEGRDPRLVVASRPLAQAAVDVPPPLADSRETLRTIAARVTQTLGASGCHVLALDAAQATFEVMVGYGESSAHAAREGQRLPLAELPEARAVATSGRHMTGEALPERIAAGEQVPSGGGGSQTSYLCVPLALGNEILGVMEVYDLHQSRAYDHQEIDLVQALANVAALTLHTSRVHHRLAATATDLSELLTTAVDLTQSSAVEGLLRSLARELATAAGAATCAVHRSGNDGLTVVASFEHGSFVAERAGLTWTTGGGAAAAVAASLAPALVDDVNAPSLDDGFRKAAVASTAVACVALLPLAFGDQFVGLVTLGFDAPPDLERLYVENRLTLQMAAAALLNFDLAATFERRAHDLSLVFEASLQDGAVLSTDDVLHTVARRMAELTHSPVADIYAVEGEVVRALVSYDGGAFDTDWEGVTVPLARYPCSKLAVESGHITVAASLDDPILTPEGRYSLEKWGYQSQLSVPLVARGQVVGLAELSDNVPRDFHDELELVLGLSQVAANALENAALFEQIERRNAILRELVELGSTITRTRDIDSLLRAVADRLLSTVDAANCDIFKLEGDQLRCIASFGRNGYDDRPVGDALDLSRYPATGAALAQRRVLVIASPEDDRLGDDERAAYRELGVASEVCIPVAAGDELYGLIDISDTRARDYAECLDFLKTAGQMVAGAFANVLLLDQLEHRTRVLRELVELSALVSQIRQPDKLLSTIAGRLRETLEAADCDIFARHGDRLECLVSVDRNGLDESVVGHVLITEKFPMTAATIETRNVLVMSSLDDPRLTDEEREDLAEYGYQSDLCIPLVAGDTVVGFIDVFDTKPRDFAEFVDFMKSVGQMVAGVIENAQLLADLERNNRQLTMLVESGLEFGATLDLDTVLSSIANRMCAVTGADCCDVYALEDETLRGLVNVDQGVADADFAGIRYRLADLALATVACESRAPVACYDCTTDERLTEFERREWLRWDFRGSLRLPLIHRGEVVGMVSVFDRRPREFERVDLLQGLAQIAASALVNATLYQEIDKSAERFSLVNRLGMEFSSILDLQQVLSSAARNLCAIANVPTCRVYTLVGDRLVCAASISDEHGDESWTGRDFGRDQLGIVRAAISSRRPVAVAGLDDGRLSAGDRESMRAHGDKSELVVPLIAKDEVIGAVELLETRRERIFSQDEIATAEAVCRVAALAIDNANLVEHLNLRNRETEVLNAIAQKTAASLHMDEIAAAAAQELQPIVPWDQSNLLLFTAEGMSTLYTSHPTALRFEGLSLDVWPAVFIERLKREKVVVLAVPEESPLGPDHPANADVRSGINIALFTEGELVGSLNLGSTRPGAYDNVDRNLLERVGTQLSLALNNARLYDDITRMHFSNLKALSSALNAKDYYTLGHAARVAAYMLLLGAELGWSPALQKQVEEAAYLHDIGKIAVSDRILLKAASLSDREWEFMRQHPVFSADIIRPLFSDELVAGVRHHHERFDGHGYPDNLAAEAIPQIARAMCVVDSYDAMSFRRPYRQALSYPEARAELRSCMGTQFDPDIAAAFLRVLTRLSRRHTQALAVARQAAARIDPAKHALLRTAEDEQRPEYKEIQAALREVREQNPVARFITTLAPAGKRFVLVVDCEEGPLHSTLGDEAFTDDEMLEIFAGGQPDRNVLAVDEFGAWVSGTAPVCDENGNVVALVSADLAPTAADTRMGGLTSDVTKSFASLLHSAATYASRAEFDAVTDGLTGLYGHRYLHERLDEEIERAATQDRSLALLVCDLDQFKEFNARHGHSAGDNVLRRVAHVVESCLRGTDLAARYGGEEFAAVLIDTDLTGALDVAERIRLGVRALREDTNGETITMSIGVAACPADATSREQLVDKADWATDLAKRRGRDQVVAFADQRKARRAARQGDYASAMARFAAAQERLQQAQTLALEHLAVAMARELGLTPAEVKRVATMARRGVTGKAPAPSRGNGHNLVPRIVAVATAYHELATTSSSPAGRRQKESLKQLRRRGEEFEPDLVAGLERVLAQKS